MSRRTFLQILLGVEAYFASLFSSTATAKTTTTSAAAATGPSPKKGAVGKWAAGQITKLKPAWYYNWNMQATEPGNIPFIPMVWGPNGVSRMDQIDRTSGILLGFNEPDYATQSNMTVDQAIALWPTLEATKLRLGSPAGAHSDGAWINDFMQRGSSLRVDFMTMHWYGMPDANKFLAAVKSLHDRFGRPIWITEFACADWNAKTNNTPIRFTANDVSKFMAIVLPALDALPYVERYTWKTNEVTDLAMGPSALFNPDGTLTSLGVQYSNS